MGPPFFDSSRLRSTVSFHDAITALREVFATTPLPDTPQRTVLTRDGGQLLLMPAWDAGGAGVKLVTVQPTNPARGLPLITGVYVLFSGDTLEPVALFDGAALTALRTAAVSGLATDLLASPDAHMLVVFGSGIQAAAHVEAMLAVRPIAEVVVVARHRDSADRFVARTRAGGLRVRVGTSEDVRGADIICTCTTAREPLFDGELLAETAHVNAIGAHTPDAREVDTAAVRRSRVVVETRSAALAEAGDLLIPLGEGEVDPARVPAYELADLIDGQATGSGPTLFKSVGVAFEDLAVARFAYGRLDSPKS